MRAIELAWAAGFIDGEGSITIDYLRANGGSRPYAQFNLSLRVGQSCEAPLLKLQSLFGGSLSPHTGKKYKRQHFTWRLCSQKAIDALVAVRPYLLVKHGHVDIALEFWQSCIKPAGWNAKGHRPESLTRDERERRFLFYTRMQALQMKGLHRRKAIAPVT